MSDEAVCMTPSAVHLERGGRVLWTYEWSASRRPYLHPVATVGGRVLTRDAPDDHPWHHGLWFTIKFVNGENFWEEYDAYGVLRHRAPPRVREFPEDLVIEGDLSWIRPDRETVVINERRTITHVPLDGPDSYAIDFHFELTPVVDVEFDRTPFTTWGGYGGLAFRGRADFHDTRLLVGRVDRRDDGGREAERVLGERGEWLDLSGYLGGDDDDADVGITFLDAPGNPNHPVPWYASTRAATYGEEGWSNFVNAAFLWDGPISVEAGEALRLDYRVVVHDGRWDADRCQAAHDSWTSHLADRGR